MTNQSKENDMTGTPALTYRARVKRGAKWLDEKDERWFLKIYQDRLDMSEACSCVLGQVFDHTQEGGKVGYHWARDHYGIPTEQLVLLGFEGAHALASGSVFEATRRWFKRNMGRDLGSNDTHVLEYRLLNEAWLEEIDNRLIAFAQRVLK